MTTPKSQMVCSRCGSAAVLRDAYAEWDVETQQWELQNVFDAAICCSEECDGDETRIDEVELEEEEETDDHANLL